MKFPVNEKFVPSNVRLASPFKLLESTAVTILLFEPFDKSANVEPHTRESISSVLNVPSESKITTELSSPVPIFGAVIEPATSKLDAETILLIVRLVI